MEEDSAIRDLAGSSASSRGGGCRPEPWNLEARRRFAGMRFGVFVHWGLYANYAQGEWYLQSAKLDEKAYSRMMDGFFPSKFDAREWARLFRRAGAKYVTFTSRHHDGFSMWPTRADDGYNVANTPFRRDVLGELAEACREEGLAFNIYYSLMDWHRKDYPAGSASRDVLGGQKGDYRSYKAFMLAQIAELLERYRPGAIWFDGEWDHAAHGAGGWTRTLDWDFDSIYDLVHSGRALVANNNHRPIRPKEDIQPFERDMPGDNRDGGFSANQPVARDRPVEQCDVMQRDVWGYRIEQKSFRPPEEIAAMAVRAAALGSNLLMNVGPDGSGRIPERAVEALEALGPWFARNGDAIYGTGGGGVAKNADGVETATTLKDGVRNVFEIRAGMPLLVRGR